MNSLILNIQKYSIHDGDGIRTTVFFKGCPLQCSWCHNPESQLYESEIMYNREKCTGCGRCVMNCPQQGIREIEGAFPVPKDLCDQCGTCVESCYHDAREKAGKSYSLEELLKEIEKDQLFYEESGGGVTLSGGEVMTQDMDDLMGILTACHKKGYSVNIDTCGHCSFQRFEAVFPYVDTFLYDIKQMDSKRHQELTGQGNERILDNLRGLNRLIQGAKAQGKRLPKINIRLPLIEGINTGEENLQSLLKFLSEIVVDRVNLLPYHQIGKSKYQRIGLHYQGESYRAPDQQKMQAIKELFISKGYDTVIGG